MKIWCRNDTHFSINFVSNRFKSYHFYFEFWIKIVY